MKQISEAEIHTRGILLIMERNSEGRPEGDAITIDSHETLELIYKENKMATKDAIVWKQLSELFLKKILIENASISCLIKR